MKARGFGEKQRQNETLKWASSWWQTKAAPTPAEDWRSGCQADWLFKGSSSLSSTRVSDWLN